MDSQSGTERPRARKKSAKASAAEWKFIQQGMLRLLITTKSRTQLLNLLDVMREDFLHAVAQEMRFRLQADPREITDVLSGKVERSRFSQTAIPVHIEGQLDAEHKDKLRSGIASLDGYVDWTLSGIRSRPENVTMDMENLQVPVQGDLTQVLDAATVFKALQLLFDGTVPDWNIKSLKIMIDVFDDLMTDVEDAFLKLQSDDSTDTIPEDEFRASLGV